MPKYRVPPARIRAMAWKRICWPGLALKAAHRALASSREMGLAHRPVASSDQVLDAPTDDHGVVGRGEDQDHGASAAQPGPLFTHVIAEAADMSAASGLSDSALGDQQRDGPYEQSNDPGKDEGTGAPGSDHAGETPNVTGTDSHAQGGKNKTDCTAPSIFLFSH